MKRFVLVLGIILLPSLVSPTSKLQIKSLVFARKLENGYAATREFRSFEQIYLFITLTNVKGNHKVKIEWYNPQNELETTTNLNLNSNEPDHTMFAWLKLGREDALIGFYRGFENKGEWKTKIFLDDKFIKEEKIKIQ